MREGSFRQMDKNRNQNGGFIKRALSAFITIFLIFTALFCAAWGYLLYKVRQPSFQQEMIASVSKQIGRNLAVNGKCDVNFMPLGLRLSEVVIKSPKNWQEQDFIKVSDFRLQIRLASLLEGRVEVERVVVRDFTLNLLSDQKRGDNWSHWGEEKKTGAVENGGSTEDNTEANLDYLALLQVNSLSLEHGNISLTQDGASQFQAVLSKLDIRDLTMRKTPALAKWLPQIVGRINFVGSCHLKTVDYKRELSLRDIDIRLKSQDGNVELSKIGFFLPSGAEGRLSGSLDIAHQPNRLAMVGQLKKLQLSDVAALAPVLKKMGGTIDLNAQIASSFSTPSEIDRYLSSTGSLELREGYYEGLDIPYQIRKALNTLKKKTSQDNKDTKRTTLDTFVAKWSGENGTINLSEVTADTPDCTLNGTGSVSLPKSSIDSKLNVQLKKETAISVPLNIRGALSNPEISLDLGELLKQQAKRLLPNLINNGLNKVLGGTEKSDAEKKDGNDAGSGLEEAIGSGLSKLLNKK